MTHEGHRDVVEYFSKCLGSIERSTRLTAFGGVCSSTSLIRRSSLSRSAMTRAFEYCRRSNVFCTLVGVMSTSRSTGSNVMSESSEYMSSPSVVAAPKQRPVGANRTHLELQQQRVQRRLEHHWTKANAPDGRTCFPLAEVAGRGAREEVTAIQPERRLRQ